MATPWSVFKWLDTIRYGYGNMYGQVLDDVGIDDISELEERSMVATPVVVKKSKCKKNELTLNRSRAFEDCSSALAKKEHAIVPR